MRIVFVASEVAPFSKTGGLADVVGALPKRVRELGHEVLVISPLYRCVARSGYPLADMGVEISVPIGDRRVAGRLRRGFLPGSDVEVWFVDQPEYYGREDLYGDNSGDYLDNCERFAFFCRAAIEALRVRDARPDVIHAHDWQAGLATAYHSTVYAADPVVGPAATVMTVHNLAYQGVFWGLDMPLIGLDWKYFNWRQLESHGDINLLKGGIVFADLVSTVSPRYAQEIQTPFQGFGLDAVLRERSKDLLGIINGIDEEEWDPATDALLPTHYSAADLRGKAECKAALQRELGLPVTDAPLLAMVGRLTWQKAPELVTSAIPGMMERGFQFVVLGSGDEDYRLPLESEAARYPRQTAVRFGFSNGLAHRIQGGADMVAMASRFEPCGLVQLCALKYGTVPVVHRTGGLADTVTDATPDALAQGTATGVVFSKYTREGLLEALDRARKLYDDPATWRGLVETGMGQDWSWNASARKYVDLYERARLVRRQRGARI